MKLFQVRYFCEAAQEENISLAAEKLHISQPAITNAIHELEQEFGVKLFHRLSRGVALTKEGTTFLELSKGLLKHSDHIEQIMRDVGNQRRTIRVGVPPMVGTILFPRLFSGFSSKHPESNLILQENGRAILMDELEQGLLDIALLAHVGKIPEPYQRADILQIEMLYCVSRKNPLASRKTVSWDEILRESLILQKDNYFQRDVLLPMSQKYGIEPRVVLSSGQLTTIREFVIHDIATSFLHRNIVETFPEIVGIPCDPPLFVEISLVWERKQYMYHDMAQFIQYTKSLDWYYQD